MEAVAEQIRDTVRPFAILLSGPSTVLPPQEAFDALSELYHARPHIDFVLPADYEPLARTVDTGYYANLPFRLALGIHAAAPYTSNSAKLKATFEEYAAAKLLTAVRGGHSAEAYAQESRARAVLIGGILTTATQRNFMSGHVKSATELAFAEGYINRSTAYKLTEMIDLTHF
jgi:hypothetical protein